MRTYSPKPQDITRNWYLIDAKDKTLGRLASETARRLQGKHKPGYAPHMDTGDYIVIINAAQIRVSGNKMQDKKYYRHSGYMGGLKTASLRQVMEKKPENAIQHAVRGMLPKGPLGRQMARKLKVFPGNEHDHGAQQPQPLEIK